MASSLPRRLDFPTNFQKILIVYYPVLRGQAVLVGKLNPAAMKLMQDHYLAIKCASYSVALSVKYFANIWGTFVSMSVCVLVCGYIYAPPVSRWSSFDLKHRSPQLEEIVFMMIWTSASLVLGTWTKNHDLCLRLWFYVRFQAKASLEKEKKNTCNSLIGLLSDVYDSSRLLKSDVQSRRCRYKYVTVKHDIIYSDLRVFILVQNSSE